MGAVVGADELSVGQLVDSAHAGFDFLAATGAVDVVVEVVFAMLEDMANEGFVINRYGLIGFSYCHGVLLSQWSKSD